MRVWGMCVCVLFVRVWQGWVLCSVCMSLSMLLHVCVCELCVCVFTGHLLQGPHLPQG